MKAKKLTKETIRELGINKRVLPEFGIGDMLAVSQWVQETNAKGQVVKRVQVFEGNVIAQNNNGASTTFTVRKIASKGIAVERIYPLHSPIIESVKVTMKAKIRRAKLYYLRDRIGKKARVKEKIQKKS